MWSILKFAAGILLVIFILMNFGLIWSLITKLFGLASTVLLKLNSSL